MTARARAGEMVCVDPEGCTRPGSEARGLCEKHYSRHRRAGTLDLFPLSDRRRSLGNQFGTCCPTCPDGGTTVLYDVDARGQIHRCIRPDHQGPRQHRDQETADDGARTA